MYPKRATVRPIEGSLEAHGSKINPKGEHAICCPFCVAIHGTPDEKFKLQYNPMKHVYYCFKCGTSGHAVIPSLEAGSLVSFLSSTPKEDVEYDLGPPDSFTPFSLAKNSVLANPYISYMSGRGYDLGILVAVHAGYCPSGRMKGRVVFPLRTMKGNMKWRGFSARTIYKGVEPKYLYPAGMNRKGELWGRDFHWQSDAWVVEGVLDALSLYPYGVAAFGKNVTDEQIHLLKEMRLRGTNITVCLDGDAWRECLVLATRLALHGVDDVRWCKLPPKTDPGTLRWKVKDYVVSL